MTRVKHHIGRYRVIAPIGAGGFSTVYRGLDEESSREVAIKVLAENHSLVPETRRRFREEFNLRATVNSPFIAEIFEVGTTETGQPYMVLELANRGDLRRRVEEIRRSHQVLNRDDLMMLARHLTEALTALHDADIIHRDVSPGNILIRSRPSSGARQGSLEQGNVILLEPGERFLLADLGHAKDLIRASGFTAGGGTQGFAAPEQRDDVTVVDHRADIFSATAIIEWAAHDGLHAEQLEPFFDIGLAAEPDERYPNMAEWYDAISAALPAPSNGQEEPKRRLRRGRSSSAGVPANASITGDIPIDELDGEAPGRRSLRVAVILAAAALVAALSLIGLTAFEQSRSQEAATDTRPGPTTSVTSTPTDRVGPGSDDADGNGTDGSEAEPLVVQAPNEEGEDSGPLPFASIDEPAEDAATVERNLVIRGTATHADGIRRVDVRIGNTDTGRFWTPPEGVGADNRFEVELAEVDPDDPISGRFEVVVTADELEPGRYLIEVWAVGTEGDIQAEPYPRFVTVG